MAQIIVCCAHKGGCAKTVTVHNLSYALSRMGKKVLAVDYDAQANLTTGLGINSPDEIPITIAHLMDAQIRDEKIPEPSEYILHCNGIDLIASSSYLSAVSASMFTEMGSERFLSKVLSPLRDYYDYILVDTGTKLDILNINALAAADQLIIPVNPQFYSTVGLEQLYGAIRKVQHRLNPKLQIAGILLTMCETRTNLCKIICQQICEAYTEKVPIFTTKIPMTIKVGESVYCAKSVIEYAPTSSAATAYKKIAEELNSQFNMGVTPRLHKLVVPKTEDGKAVE